MKLKELNKSSSLAGWKAFSRHKERITFLVILFFLFIYSASLFTLGLSSSQNRFLSINYFQSGEFKPFTFLNNKVRGFFSNPDHLHFDISHKHFQRIAYKRDVAMMMGHLVVNEDDFVPASIRMNSQSIPIKLRLKGDLVDHLKGDKWSYRVKTKGDARLYKMKEFSIQHPRTRNFLAEWVFHQALQREQLISLRYDFVDVSINGKYLGVFAIEEHFNSELVEFNERRAGPIIRLSEEQLWGQWNGIARFQEAIPFSSAAFSANYVDAFESKAIAQDPLYKEQFMRAASLLEAFRTEKKVTSEVFDVQKLAMYLALTELLGAHHSTIWHNMRFYYNPVTGKLEPVGYDANAGFHELPMVTASMSEYDTFEQWMMEIFYYATKDPIFNKAYRMALQKVADPAYLQSLYKDLSPDFNQKLRILHKSYPRYSFPFETIEKNRQLLHHVIYPKDGLRVHFNELRQDTLMLQVGSTQSLPVQLHSVHTSSSLDPIPFEPTLILPGRIPQHSISFKDMDLIVPDTLLISDSTLALFAVSYSIPGIDSVQYASIVPYPHLKQALIDNEFTTNTPTDSTFEFLTINIEDSTVTSQKEQWLIDHNLILRKGYSLHVPEGTVIDLTDGAAIIAYGPVHFEGTSRAPIRMVSSDSTGQGLVVLNAAKESELTHTTFKGLSHLDQFGWTQTGSVTFHESSVAIRNVTFSSNRSEDALNIIRSSFTMDSVRFSHIHSDAFDGDFTEGEVRNSVFEHLGNDGIDVSGSKLSFYNVRISGAGDKALSAGEYSIIEGRDLDISNSEIAIASKDNSIVTINRATITDSRLGVTLFQKKPEFGPASLEANDFVIRNTEVPSLIEEGSLFMMNGERIPANNKNVSELLYGNLYGTASK